MSTVDSAGLDPIAQFGALLNRVSPKKSRSEEKSQLENCVTMLQSASAAASTAAQKQRVQKFASQLLSIVQKDKESGLISEDLASKFIKDIKLKATPLTKPKLQVRESRQKQFLQTSSAPNSAAPKGILKIKPRSNSQPPSAKKVQLIGPKSATPPPPKTPPQVSKKEPAVATQDTADTAFYESVSFIIRDTDADKRLKPLADLLIKTPTKHIGKSLNFVTKTLNSALKEATKEDAQTVLKAVVSQLARHPFLVGPLQKNDIETVLVKGNSGDWLLWATASPATADTIMISYKSGDRTIEHATVRQLLHMDVKNMPDFHARFPLHKNLHAEVMGAKK